MKRKLNEIKRHVQGKFFTLERKNRNKTERFCAKFISESPHYITFMNVNSKTTHKINKDSVVSLNCGAFTV